MPGVDDQSDSLTRQETTAARDAYAAGRDINIVHNYGQSPVALPADSGVTGDIPQGVVGPGQPGVPADRHLEGERGQPDTAESESAPAPVLTDRWRHTSDGFAVPALMRLTHTGVSHVGYMSRQTQDEPPSVKVGMLVACQTIDPVVRRQCAAGQVQAVPRLGDRTRADRSADACRAGRVVEDPGGSRAADP